ncbi:hypothetical protein BT63DRAFT_477128 [Microthyrium microscopicum]|uniref:Uncharacterized protein n=1 Tax=Microthyrium microscopicum TaxID=703497 RepID=A0A6A6UKP4_9PEZI|nr:hypothetical protein BT63DRAFT_477128 [Microthyrium microscopicum]
MEESLNLIAARFPELKVLHLKYNKAHLGRTHGTDAGLIMRVISAFVHLKELYLSGFSLHKLSTVEIPRGTSSVTTLSIRNCQFSQDILKGLLLFPRELEKLACTQYDSDPNGPGYPYYQDSERDSIDFQEILEPCHMHLKSLALEAMPLIAAPKLESFTWDFSNKYRAWSPTPWGEVTVETAKWLREVCAICHSGNYALKSVHIKFSDDEEFRDSPFPEDQPDESFPYDFLNAIDQRFLPESIRLSYNKTFAVAKRRATLQRQQARHKVRLLLDAYQSRG